MVAIGCEVPNAVPFDPMRPNLVVERVKERLATTEHRRVTVVAASGGCGATTVALHLAAAASSGACLVFGGPGTGVAHRLGLDPETVSSTPVPVPGGFKVACADKAELDTLTAALGDRFASVVVDAGSAASSILHTSDACVLVLSPTVPSARAAAGLLQAFPDRPWAVVTNRLGPGGETGSAELQRILGRRIALQLPCSRGLRDAEGEGRLVSSWSPWWRRVERLARALQLR